MQYNTVLGKYHTAKWYRQMFLQELGIHMQNSIESLNVSDILVMGDINQHVEDPQIVQFMNTNGLVDVHRHVNDLGNNALDNTFKTGKKCIDVVLCTHGLLEYISGSQMVECDEVIINDHRGYLLDLEIERYCKCKLSKYDKPRHTILNNNKTSHVEIFNEKINEVMNQLNVKQRVLDLKHIRSREAFNVVDDLFTTVFDKARSAVEGPTRSIPFSQRKLELSNKQLYWALRVKQLQGKTINVERMNRRKELGKITESCQTLEQAKEQYEKEKEKWNIFKQHQLLYVEQELLDQYKGTINGDDEQQMLEKRTKAIKTVREKLWRNNTFTYLTRHVGKPKNALTKLRAQESNNGKLQTYYERKEIESKLIMHNRKHFSKAKDTKVYKNRIIKALNQNEIRDKILKGTITKDEVNDKDVYDFLRLLALPNGQEITTKKFDPITLEDWKYVVKKSKRKSVSSVFSRRTYVVYKLVNDNDEFLEVLLLFYNLALKKGIILKRWQDILDIILEKGKGPLLGKLRIIELIEGDMQIITRMYVGLRNDKNIENDSRLSKFNFGSRKWYSIESAILEKRLMYDTSRYSGEPTVHLFSDLDSCYDRQIPMLAGIVEESLGVNRSAIKVICDTVSKFKHFTCTGYGISNEYYGGDLESLTGTGQGNMLSGAVCRDQSCFVFKKVERMKKGVELILPLTLKRIRRTIIAYVDDTDFYTNGKDFIEKIKEIIDLYVRLYEATGAKIQKEKVKFYCWKYIMVNGDRRIEQIEVNIKIKNQEIEQINVYETTRTLGVYVTPALEWKTQFEVLRKKVVDAMGKVMNTHLTYQQTSMYYNLYMLANVYFRCGIMKLHEKEEIELRRLYESTILRKLGFSKNFPRKIMYVSKEMLGLGLFLPSTMIAIQGLKLYLGNKRSTSNASRMINALEEMMWVEGGLNKDIINDENESFWTESWVDEIKEIMKQRKIILCSEMKNEFRVTRNKSIMAYAREYVENVNTTKDTMKLINHVRLYKKVYLPCELLGQRGREQTIAYRENKAQSQIKWTFYHHEVEIPSKKAFKRWKGFIEWLQQRNIETIFDFDDDAVWNWRLRDDQNVLLVNEGQEKKVFVKTLHNEYKEIEWRKEYEEGKFHGIIGILYSNGRLRIQFQQNQPQIRKVPESVCVLSDKEFYIRDCIMMESAYAACDGSKKDNLFGGYCVITDVARSKSIRWKCSSNKWELNNVQTSEGYPLMMLFELVYKVSVGLRRGKVVIYVDRKHLIKEMMMSNQKASDFVKDCGAIKCRIMEIKDRLNIKIEMKYSSKDIENSERFEDNRGGHLMLECDTQSKLIRRRMENEEEDNKYINYIGNHALLVDNVPCDRGVKELIRKIDSRRMMKEYCKEKFKSNSRLIDIEARYQFHGATRSAIKCMIGYNHYGKRHSIINQNIPSTRCPRCGEEETWSHVITCRTLADRNVSFVKEVQSELSSQAITEQQKVAVQKITQDIEKFLLNAGNRYDTNQKVIGWENAFRGYIVKRLRDDCNERYFNENINRRIIKRYTSYYMECWFERNEQFHDEDKQRKYVLEWTKALEERILKSNKVNAIRCLQQNKVRLEDKTTNYLQSRNKYLMKVYKDDKEETRNADVRSYFKLKDGKEG